MARPTAIRITNQEIRAREYRSDARQDSSSKRPMKTADVLASLRAKRDELTSDELLRRAGDAARLTMRGDQFSAEDRKDCAAEITWMVLAKMPGAQLPNRTDKRADLTALRNHAQNWRRALIRRRAADIRANQDAQARRATSWTRALDSLHLDLSAGAAEDAADNAAAAANAACERLRVPSGGAIWTALYQWTRDATAEICGADIGITANAWAKRAHAGHIAIYTLCPDASDLIATLTGADTGRSAIDGAVLYSLRDERISQHADRMSSHRLTPRSREGTNGGDTPVSAQDCAQARELSAVRHQCPTADLATYGRAAARRGGWHSAVVGADRRMYWYSGAIDPQTWNRETKSYAADARGLDPRCVGLGAPRTALQLVADAHRRAALATMRSGARERAVHYSPDQYKQS
jgi:hypothetical protein